MNFIFFCGSLEPGKDGVGDYTRRLAGELIQLGHAARIIALYDKEVSSFLVEEQKDLDTSIKTLRLPQQESWQRKRKKIKDFSCDQEVDFLSLQFVPYSFNDKGLPMQLGSKLKSLNIKAPWHIMFHELWVGIDQEASLKIKVIGKLQKLIVRRLVTLLKPVRLFTNTTVYSQLLQRLGQEPEILPVFSNIIPSVDRIFKPFNSIKLFNIAVFGSIQKGAFLDDFLNFLEVQQRDQDVLFKFHFIGRNGTQADLWKNILTRRNFNFVDYKVFESEKISELIMKCDFGVSTTPFLQTEKSGSVAALLAHQKPVVCIGRNWTTAFLNNTDLKLNGVVNLDEFFELGLIGLFCFKKVSDNSYLETINAYSSLEKLIS